MFRIEQEFPPSRLSASDPSVFQGHRFDGVRKLVDPVDLLDTVRVFPRQLSLALGGGGLAGDPI